MLKHKHNKTLSFKSAASPTMKFVLWLLSGQFSLQFFSSILGLVVSPSVSPRGQQQERKEALHSSPTAAVYHLPVFLCFGNFHGCISGQNRQSGPQIAAVPAKARRHPSHDGRTAGQNKGRSRKAGELRQQGAAWSRAGGRPRREAGPERKSCSGWRLVCAVLGSVRGRLPRPAALGVTAGRTRLCRPSPAQRALLPLALWALSAARRLLSTLWKEWRGIVIFRERRWSLLALCCYNKCVRVICPNLKSMTDLSQRNVCKWHGLVPSLFITTVKCIAGILKWWACVTWCQHRLGWRN